jgi:uncharacterized membrane protein YgcG
MGDSSSKQWIVLAVGLMVVTGGVAHGQSPDGGGDGMRGDASLVGAQRVMGTVTAATGEKFTVKTEKGEIYSVVVTANTRFVRERQPVRVADVHVGDVAFAIGTLDEGTKTEHALLVNLVSAEQAKKAREGLGKVYIAGKVTAIDDLKLTVLRSDGVSQVIEVDEGTSFRRGARGLGSVINGQSGFGTGGGATTGGGRGGNGSAGGSGAEILTLADVKVGDGVVGPGSLKNGVFVPSELGVIDEAAMERRKKRAEGGGAPGAAPTTAPASPQ